jgi:hypothetical protein
MSDTGPQMIGDACSKPLDRSNAFVELEKKLTSKGKA